MFSTTNRILWVTLFDLYFQEIHHVKWMSFRQCFKEDNSKTLHFHFCRIWTFKCCVYFIHSSSWSCTIPVPTYLSFATYYFEKLLTSHWNSINLHIPMKYCKIEPILCKKLRALAIPWKISHTDFQARSLAWQNLSF